MKHSSQTVSLAGCVGVTRHALTRMEPPSSPAPVVKTDTKGKDVSAAHLFSPSAWAVRNHGAKL